MVECVRGLDDIAKYRRFRLLRPDKNVTESPKAWWIYAARCHGFDLMRQRHRTHDVTKENLRYLDLYTKLIINPNETITSEQKEFKDRLEKDRTYYELKFLREVSIRCTRMILVSSISIRTIQISDLHEPNPGHQPNGCNGSESGSQYAGPMVSTVVGLV